MIECYKVLNVFITESSFTNESLEFSLTLFETYFAFVNSKLLLLMVTVLPQLWY